MSDFLYEVDVGSFEFGYKQMIRSTTSFTYLDWKLANMIRAKQKDVDDLDDEEVEKLLLNIFPDCSTALHIVAYNPEQFEKLIERVF